jgi:hypothetical protein
MEGGRGLIAGPSARNKSQICDEFRLASAALECVWFQHFGQPGCCQGPLRFVEMAAVEVAAHDQLDNRPLHEVRVGRLALIFQLDPLPGDEARLNAGSAGRPGSDCARPGVETSSPPGETPEYPFRSCQPLHLQCKGGPRKRGLGASKPKGKKGSRNAPRLGRGSEKVLTPLFSGVMIAAWAPKPEARYTSPVRLLRSTVWRRTGAGVARNSNPIEQ